MPSAPDATEEQRTAPQAPSAASRAALGCLVLMAFALPLVPVHGGLLAIKHLAFLGLGVLGLACVWVDAVRGGTAPSLGTPTDLALVVWLATTIPAAFLAANPGLARYAIGLVAALGISYLLALKAVRRPRDVHVLLLAIFAAGVLVAVDGLVGFQRFVQEGAPEAERRAFLSTRFFAHSYLAAQYLVMVLVGGVVMCFAGQLPRALRAVLVAGLLLIGSYLVVVGSRGSYLACVVALLTWLLLQHRTTAGPTSRTSWFGLRALMLLGAMVACAVGITLVFEGGGPEAASTAFEPATRPVSLSRLQLWASTLRMAADHLVTGVGIGSYDTVLPRYHFAPSNVPHAHNQFLHVLAEMGLLGLLAFLFLVHASVHAARKGAWALAADDTRRPLLLAGVSALVAALVSSLFETPLAWAEAGSLVMILLAVITRAGCVSRERTTSRAAAFGGLALLAALLATIAPNWHAYLGASALTSDHVRRLDAAEAARRDGDDGTAAQLLDEVLDNLEEADTLFPHHDFAALQADALVRFDRYEEALAAHRLADARMPGTFEHNSAIGSLLMELERPQEAIEPLRRAILGHRGLESLDTYVRLGQAYAAARRYEEAWIVFDDLLERHIVAEQRPVIFKEAAWTLVHLGREVNTARVLLDRYTQLAPDDDSSELVVLRRHITGMLNQPRDQRRR